MKQATLQGYEILLGVTGGIAAFKAAALCSQLKRAGAGVSVVMTEHAQRFVTPLTFASLSGRRVYVSLWEMEKDYDPAHISLTEGADLIVVAPASANMMAKLQAGIADDLLSTLLLSAASEVLLAPAMNTRMYQHAATQRNLQCLRESGVHMVGPESGRLACGTEGMGRMSEPETIVEKITDVLSGKSPKGR